MKEMEELILAVLRKHFPTIITTGTAVNVTDSICDIERAGLPVLQGARLNVVDNVENYVTTVPKEGSEVLAVLPDGRGQAMVIGCSEVEKVIWRVGDSKQEFRHEGIVYNEGENGGMVKVQELEQNLEYLKNYVQAINTALPGAFTAIGASSAANGANGASSYQSAMSGQVINFENMENIKIKH